MAGGNFGNYEMPDGIFREKKINSMEGAENSLSHNFGFYHRGWFTCAIIDMTMTGWAASISDATEQQIICRKPDQAEFQVQTARPDMQAYQNNILHEIYSADLIERLINLE